MLRIVVFLVCVFLSSISNAKSWQCWFDAAEKYRLPPTLLFAIAHVESGNKARAIGRNGNGTYDIGLMQINSMHLPNLQKEGITARRLIEDPCLNLHVGARILRESIDRYGWNWRGLGAYNASDDRKRMIYAKKVLTKHREIFLRERFTNNWINSAYHGEG